MPTLSGLLTGFGIYVVFMQMLNYIIGELAFGFPIRTFSATNNHLDVYLMFAASAVAGNSIMRSLAGAIFPMFAIYMFDGIVGFTHNCFYARPPVDLFARASSGA